MLTPAYVLEIAEAVMKGAYYCFLATLDESGRINARLMQPFAPEPDLTIWFGTSPKSRKIHDIQQRPRVTVAFQEAVEPAYVALSGSAQIVDDINLRQTYWREEWRNFFPDGPSGDDYVLIKFIPSQIEVLHFARQVTPEPFGLQPAVLVRFAEAWVLANSETKA